MSEHKNGTGSGARFGERDAIAAVLARLRQRAVSQRSTTAIRRAARAEGLYDPRARQGVHCGVGFFDDIKCLKSHLIVEDGLRILCNL